MIPTIDEYNKAKEITQAYESEQNRLFNIRLDAFKVDLTEYFKSNLVEGHRIKEFELRGTIFNRFEIVPTEPSIEEDYEGENNADIEKLCEKHEIEASFVYWMYHK